MNDASPEGEGTDGGPPATGLTGPVLGGSAKESMPVWVPRAIAMFLGGSLVLYIAWSLYAQLQTLLMLVVISLFASFALEPAVNWFSGRGLRRGLATGLVMVGGFVVTMIFVALIGQVVVDQVADFVDELPENTERLETWLNDRFGLEIDSGQVVEDLTSEDTGIQDLASSLAGNALDVTTRALGLVFNFFTIMLFTFYMVADGPRFRRTVLQFLSPDRQARVLSGWETAIDKTGGYIYSRALLALFSAVATTIVLWVLGVPFAFALGLWTGLVSQFVPTIGTYIGGALPVLVALSNEPLDAALVLGFIIIYQQIENYVFAPKITARTMDLHPAVAFGTVIAGASLLGGVGAILALPAAAVIQAIGSTYVARHQVIDSDMTRDHRPGRRSASTDPAEE